MDRLTSFMKNRFENQGNAFFYFDGCAFFMQNLLVPHDRGNRTHESHKELKIQIFRNHRSDGVFLSFLLLWRNTGPVAEEGSYYPFARPVLFGLFGYHAVLHDSDVFSGAGL
ncbi:MAG: hypothetical protein IKX90_06080 [Verrucomicrobia bacterium]|nr:hypothetical protein [Verrucomicrobiota bacterium]